MKETRRKDAVEIPTVRERRIEKLDGTIFVPEGAGPFPGVLFCHGRASDPSSYLPIGERLARAGVSALAFGFPSDELLGRQTDAESAYFFFQTHTQIDAEKIGVLGVTMGAYQATLIASKFKVRSLLLRAPAAYPMNKNSPSIHAIRGFEGDLLIVESELDEIIPHKIIELYLKNAVKSKRKELKVLRGATHWLGEPNSKYRQEFQRIVVDWFSETLGPPCATAKA